MPPKQSRYAVIGVDRSIRQVAILSFFKDDEGKTKAIQIGKERAKEAFPDNDMAVEAFDLLSDNFFQDMIEFIKKNGVTGRDLALVSRQLGRALITVLKPTK